MNTVTLAKAELIAKAIDDFSDPLDFERLMEFVEYKTHCTRGEIIITIEFLQRIGRGVKPKLPARLDIDTSKPIDLAQELIFNYTVGKTLLEQILEDEKADNEEIRKTLREISRFLESMLKMQERVFNVQQIQKFQECVLDIIGSADKELRDRVVELLMESSL